MPFRVPMFLWMGLRNFTRGGYEKAARRFEESPMDEPMCLKGRTVMVTGTTQGGIGYQIALEAAARGANVVCVCRDSERGQRAVESIRMSSNNENVTLKICDLSQILSIKGLADEYRRDDGPPVHVLVCNAGIMMHDQVKSKEGFEMNMAVNTLGTYALIKYMSCALKRADPDGRVIVVSSGGALTEHLEVEDLEMNKGRFNATVQYARDKRRQLAIVEHFAKEWKDDTANIYAMHPGWTETPGVEKSMPSFYSSMKDRFRSLQQGADTVVYLACQDQSKLKSGEFYLDRMVQSKHLPLGGTKYKEADVDKLIAKLDNMIAIAEVPSTSSKQ